MVIFWYCFISTLFLPFFRSILTRKQVLSKFSPLVSVLFCGVSKQTSKYKTNIFILLETNTLVQEMNVLH